MKRQSTGTSHRIVMRAIFATCALAFFFLCSASAEARDIVHRVREGQNLGMIAKRYHTTAKAIRARNKLSKKKHIYPGQKLRIVESAEHKKWREFYTKKNAPKRKKAPKKRAKVDKRKPKSKSKRSKSPRKAHESNTAKATKYTSKARRPGRVHLRRFGRSLRTQLVDSSGRIKKTASKRVDRFMRSWRTGKRTEMNRRLYRLLAQVSDHFGGRKMVIVSGYRPYRKKQFTKNSRHNHGDAIDFKVVGVPLKTLFAFCKGFKNVGCGLYPNSGFVHMDVRAHKTQWTDLSRPGQAPIYAHKRKTKRKNKGKRSKGKKSKQTKAKTSRAATKKRRTKRPAKKQRAKQRKSKKAATRSGKKRGGSRGSAAPSQSPS